MPYVSFGIASYSENIKSKFLTWLLLNSFFGVLYAVLKKDELFSNINRARVYQVISDFPKLCYFDILKKTKLGNGTLIHHLNVLEKEKIILSYPDGRYKRYILHPEQQNKSAQEIHNDISKVDDVMRSKLLKAIEEYDSITQKELSKIAGVSKQIVSYHIKKLEFEGLIRTEKHGLTKRCYFVEKK